MAHELSFTDGRADFFTVRQTAWHREGIVLDDHPSLDRALEVARLDYEVKKLPVTYTPAEGAEPRQSSKAFVTVRMDRGIELGAVGADYTVVPNADAFRASIGPLVDAGVLKLETGGVLREGADAWLLGSFDVERFGPVTREIFADEVIPYALVTVNHAGRRNNTVALTPIRVVCANTLGMAEQQIDGGHAKASAVRHTGDAQARMVEAAEDLFGGIIERYEVIAKQYRLLKQTILDEAAFQATAVLPAIGVHPTRRDEFNPEARLAEATVERYEKRRDEITRLRHEGAGHAGDGSAWEAYNAVVEAVDHRGDLFPARSGVYRLGSLLEGTLRHKKQSALDAIVSYSEHLLDRVLDATERTSILDRAILTTAR